jgi:hypothetical protein
MESKVRLVRNISKKIQIVNSKRVLPGEVVKFEEASSGPNLFPGFVEIESVDKYIPKSVPIIPLSAKTIVNPGFPKVPFENMLKEIKPLEVKESCVKIEEKKVDKVEVKHEEKKVDKVELKKIEEKFVRSEMPEMKQTKSEVFVRLDQPEMKQTKYFTEPKEEVNKVESVPFVQKEESKIMKKTMLKKGKKR